MDCIGVGLIGTGFMGKSMPWPFGAEGGVGDVSQIDRVALRCGSPPC